MRWWPIWRRDLWTPTISSSGVVENDTQCIPAATMQPAHAVPHIDAIASPAAAHRALAHRKDHRFALPQRHDVRARLHARSLLGEHEFTAGEVGAGLRQQ